MSFSFRGVYPRVSKSGAKTHCFLLPTSYFLLAVEKYGMRLIPADKKIKPVQGPSWKSLYCKRRN